MPFPVPLRGVVPPLCTPLSPDGEVDTGSLRSLTEHLLSAGVHGLFALGTAGEAVFLDSVRRATALRTVVDAVDGRVPVLAGVIDTGTVRVLDHARTAADAGADALVATVPFYAAPHPAEIATHYRLIRAEVDLPLLAYNIPSATHTELAAVTVLELAEADIIDGLKDSSGDAGALRRLLVALRPRALEESFAVLTGSELSVDAALLAGAHGAVPGLANVDPEGFVRLYHAAVAGRWPEAVAEQDRLTTLFSLTEAGGRTAPGMGALASSVGGFKAALYLLGVIDCPVTAAPQTPLDTASVARVRSTLQTVGLPVRR